MSSDIEASSRRWRRFTKRSYRMSFVSDYIFHLVIDEIMREHSCGDYEEFSKIEKLNYGCMTRVSKKYGVSISLIKERLKRFEKLERRRLLRWQRHNTVKEIKLNVNPEAELRDKMAKYKKEIQDNLDTITKCDETIFKLYGLIEDTRDEIIKVKHDNI